MQFDAFISYRRDNGFLMAQVIHDRLKDRGINCFLDLEEDRSGKFDEALLTAIAQAPYFLLVLPRNALNRCKNTDDWVRREILAAIDGTKTIIPIMYDGFKWPKKWDPAIPEPIRQLQYNQGVSMSQEYLSAMIDKIIGYMPDVIPFTNIAQLNIPKKALPTDTVSFIAQIKANPDNVESVCLAFHAGSEWRRAPGKVELLQYMLEHQIPLKVIVNSGEAANTVCSHMKQPLKRYTGIDHCVEEWLELQTLYPELVQVRIAQVPLLHRIYLLRNRDGSGLANIKYYTYGNYTPAKDYRTVFDADSPQFGLYSSEFDYLWRKG